MCDLRQLCNQINKDLGKVEEGVRSGNGGPEISALVCEIRARTYRITNLSNGTSNAQKPKGDLRTQKAVSI